MTTNDDRPPSQSAETYRRRYREDPVYREKKKERARTYNRKNKAKVSAYHKKYKLRKLAGEDTSRKPPPPDAGKLWRKKERARKKAVWAALTPEERTIVGRVRKYGLTLEGFNKLWVSQKGLCPICQEPLQPYLTKNRKLHVDHCHRTRRIRGLLCGMCNIGLGHFRDDADKLHRAASYLEVRDNNTDLTVYFEDWDLAPLANPFSKYDADSIRW